MSIEKIKAEDTTHEKLWPENCWYVVAMSDELQTSSQHKKNEPTVNHRPLGRIIANKHVVMYRDNKGSVHALEDFCPHRGLPLSKGYIDTDKDKLVCGYHGMVMNCDGTCHSMPGQKVDRLKGIQSYPVIDKYNFIWIWIGDSEKADEDLIPDLQWAHSNDWTYGGDYYHMKCDYRLLIDNLMDLTHETYVHASSIGQSEIEDAAPTTSQHNDEIRVERLMESIVPPPFWGDALEANNISRDSVCDRWQVCRFVPPSQVMIDVGVAVAGNGAQDAPADQRVSAIVVDLITPETETTCHYFWGMARNFNVSNQQLTKEMREAQGKIFAEDLDILESQQENLLRNPDRRLIPLNIDAGGVYARRKITKIIKQESL
ncbi:MAG: aromatic ring-hydroxylating dioxygenase subunit alpha [Cellvibrionaceae bacterium]